MGVHRRKDGPGWKAIVYVHRKPVASKTFSSKAEAEKWFTNTSSDYMRGVLRAHVPGTDQPVTFAELASSFIEHSKGSCRPRTLNGYQGRLNACLIPTFGERRFGTITRADVLQFKSLKLRTTGKASSVNHDLAILKAVLYFALEQGWISSNPVARIRPAHEPEVVKRRFYAPEEVEEMLTKLDPATEEYGLVVSAFSTGMRPAELMSFRLDWVNWSLDAINIPNTIEYSPKGHRPRTLPLLPRLKNWLLGLGRTEGFAFQKRGTSEKGALKKLRARYHEIRRLTGVKFNLYDARHTYASQLLADGVPLHEVQAAMGHSTITTTIKNYAHLSPAYLARVRASLARQWGENPQVSKLRVVKA